MKATWGSLESYPCLMLRLGTADSLPLLQWKGLLGVEDEWPAGWAEQIERETLR